MVKVSPAGTYFPAASVHFTVNYLEMVNSYDDIDERRHGIKCKWDEKKCVWKEGNGIIDNI